MKLRFVYRSECSLCEAMWVEWQAYLESLDEDLKRELGPVDRVDLGDRPDLEAAYGRRVPVLEVDGHELCRYFFDPEAVSAHFSGPGSNASAAPAPAAE